MIQKIFHIIWAVFGVVFIAVLIFVSVIVIQISHVADNIQSTMEDLTREDVTRVLNILEQQVVNEQLKYYAQLAETNPAFYGERGWMPSPRKIKFHFIDNEGWFAFWDSGNYTIMQRVEPWFESEFGGDWEVLFDETK